MLAHLVHAFRGLFPTRRSRVAVGGLVVVTAMLPVLEMLVLRMFSTLIVDGPRRLDDDPRSLAVTIAVFFAAFGATRLAHHAVRLGRVRVIRKGFDASGRTRTPSQESWEWALAFELSGVLVSLVQAVMFSAFFLAIDWPTGALNVVLCVAVLAWVSLLYRRQLRTQRDYVAMGTRPGTVAIAVRVGVRIRDAELGAILASSSMVLVLVLMLVRTLSGDISAADAIVLFLALRLLSGQLASLSSGVMRFARASARRGEY